MATNVNQGKNNNNFLHPDRTYSQGNIFTNNSQQLQPKLKQNGYIIGPPIAYTQSPHLVNKQVHHIQQIQPIITRPPLVSRQNRTTTSITPPKVHIASYPNSNILRNDMIPKRQYQRVLNDCRLWQQRYNQLYAKSLNGNSLDLLQQNNRLRHRIVQLQAAQRNISDNLQAKLNQLARKYHQSTIKQCQLLVDRYRLQCRHTERFQ